MKNILLYLCLIISNAFVYLCWGENILFITVIASIALIIFIDIKTHRYICSECKQKFSIKYHQILSLHAGEYRKLKCPICGATTLAKIIKK
ncbi:hypothetical protein [Romboutsia sp. MSSM.1001216sp_RTP31141st1_G3_RTP31141_220114]|uniref:hypothetical protein n=1 Tax=unclassified Romboutsia TaxID=2626894 RepID=UPI0031B5D2BC